MKVFTDKKLYFTILFFTIFPFLSLAEGREKINFCSNWKFKSKITNNTPAASSLDDSSWEIVNIPHTWNAKDAQDGGSQKDNNKGTGYLQTTSWYRKNLPWKNSYTGKKIYIEFLGANIQTECFVNGESVGIHKGGYTAFRYDITDKLQEGNNLIAVKVDNNNNSGKLQDIAPLSGDFSFYGGIYRKVHIIITEPVHIDLMEYASSGLYLTTTKVSKTSANLEIRANVINDSNLPKTVNLKAILKHPDTFEAISEIEKPEFDIASMSKNGEIIETLKEDNVIIPPNSSYEFKKEITVKNPRLWDGRVDPYRYLVDFTINQDSKIIDQVSDYVGFRFFSVNQSGFYLNGRLYPLRGICRHQDWQDMGNAITENEHNIDFGMMYDIGANTVRLAHYPQDPYIYDLCDRYGLVVWAEIPFVDHIGNDSNFEEVTRQQLEEMIRQQYNRPSIVMWGLQNEVKSNYDSKMRPIMQGLHDLSYSIDPTRLTVQATNQGTARNWKSDLIGWNIYHGWYQDGSLGGFMDGCRNKTVPEGMAEYGAGGNIEQHEIGRTTRPQHDGEWHPEEWQNEVHEKAIKDINTRNYIWGTYIWNMFEFGSDWRDEGERPGVNDKGLVSFDRKVKKDSYFIYKANWSKEPVIYIASRRFEKRDLSDIPVTIYSNCESVELFLNGVSIGKKMKSTTQSGIFKWNNITLEKGEENTIKAVGIVEGKEYIDEITWTRILANSTDLISSTLSVNNDKKQIGLTYDKIDVSQLSTHLTGDKGATFILVEKDGTTLVETGYVSIGMKVIVTSEDSNKKAIYTIVAAQHLALSKTVTTDSFEAANVAKNAVDGDSNTRWAAANASAHWIQVDLGRTYILNQIKIHWFNNTSSPRSYKYTVTGSNNGKNYFSLVDRSANTTQNKVADKIDNKQARYIKINAAAASIGYPSIYEIEVYGWMLESETYEVNLNENYIIIPEPKDASNITTAEFMNNINISGIQKYDLQVASYFIQNGDKLVITDSENKKNEFIIYIGNPVRINNPENENNLFSVINTSNATEIKLTSNISSGYIEVYDYTGKKIHSSFIENNYRLRLIDGAYIFKLSNDNSTQTVKHIVQ